MEQLVPGPLVGELADVLLADDRPAPAGRPWVMANMVGSVDGAFAREGRSAGLSNEADRELFHTLRAVADVVLVAAGTARTERYRRPAAAGAADTGLAVVSASLRIPEDQPFLSGPGPDPVVYHPPGADTSSVPAGVELREAGTDPGRVDLSALLADLADHGARVVLCEGGPSLLGQLAGVGLLDELFLTVSPVLVGGDQVGLVGHGGPYDVALGLHRLLRVDDVLFATYRTRHGSA